MSKEKSRATYLRERRKKWSQEKVWEREKERRCICTIVWWICYHSFYNYFVAYVSIIRTCMNTNVCMFCVHFFPSHATASHLFSFYSILEMRCFWCDKSKILGCLCMRPVTLRWLYVREFNFDGYGYGGSDRKTPTHSNRMFHLFIHMI